MRAGGATALAAAGVPDDRIRILGRWSSDSYQVYIRKHPLLLLSHLASWRSVSFCILYCTLLFLFSLFLDLYPSDLVALPFILEYTIDIVSLLSCTSGSAQLYRLYLYHMLLLL